MEKRPILSLEKEPIKSENILKKISDTPKTQQKTTKFQPTSIGIIYEEISLIDSMDDDK